jgi:leader peptidase (prepilin peptidase)/N-methyltransferase
MPDPVLVLSAALATGLATAGATAPLLRRLPEPSAEDLGNETKITYAQLARTRFIAGAAAVSVAAAIVSWTLFPVRLQPLWTVLAVLGVLVAAIDALTTWIPRRLTHVAWLAMLVAVGLAAVLGASLADAVRTGIGALLAGGLYLLMWAVSRGAFGFGDVRFAPLLGAAAAAHSWQLLAATLALGSVVGAGHGLARLSLSALRPEPGRTAEFPYAPSMLAGAYLAAVIVVLSG